MFDTEIYIMLVIHSGGTDVLYIYRWYRRELLKDF